MTRRDKIELALILIFLAGTAATTLGLGLIYWPLALIAFGLASCFFAIAALAALPHKPKRV